MLLDIRYHCVVPLDERRGDSVSITWRTFQGSEKIPFGAMVEFKPSDARGDKREKFEPKGETGIFAGYDLRSGLHWACKYRAWTLTSFAGADLSIRKAKIPPRLRQPHQTERIVLKIPISFPVQDKHKKRNETLERVEDIRGEDDRGVHLEQPAEDEDPDPTLFLNIDQGQLDEVEEIAGIAHDEKGEDVEVVEPGSTEDKDAVVDVADLPHASTGKAKDGIIYRNDLGKTVKLHARGRPYPVGADGFRTMKTARPSHDHTLCPSAVLLPCMGSQTGRMD